MNDCVRSEDKLPLLTGSKKTLMKENQTNITPAEGRASFLRGTANNQAVCSCQSK